MNPSKYDGFVRQIYDGVLAPDGWTILLRGLCVELHCEQAAFLMHHHSSNKTIVGEVVETDERFIGDYESHYATLDPGRRFVSVLSTGAWYVDDQALGKPFKQHSEFYQDYLKQYGLGHILCASLANNSSTLAGITFQAAIKRPIDLDRLCEVTPLLVHLATATEMRLRFNELSQAAKFGRQMLNCLVVPIMVVNRDAVVLFANREAERWLECDQTLFGAVPTVKANRQRTQLRRLARSICAQENVTSLSLPLSSDAGQNTGSLIGLPLSATHPLAAQFDEPVGMVVLQLQGLNSPSGLALMRDLYRLTKAEIRLIEAWTDQPTLYDAAAVLGLQRTTVRTQIKSVFQKTGCGSQVELARLVSQLGGLPI